MSLSSDDSAALESVSKQLPVLGKDPGETIMVSFDAADPCSCLCSGEPGTTLSSPGDQSAAFVLLGTVAPGLLSCVTDSLCVTKLETASPGTTHGVSGVWNDADSLLTSDVCELEGSEGVFTVTEGLTGVSSEVSVPETLGLGLLLCTLEDLLAMKLSSLLSEKVIA